MKITWQVALAILVMLLVWHLYNSYSRVDGFQGFMWRTLAGEDTLFATGYTDRGFIEITNGARRDEVYELVGSPLGVWTNSDSTISERWSKSPSDGNYRCRVVFFTSNIVTQKHSEFYED